MYKAFKKLALLGTFYACSSIQMIIAFAQSNPNISVELNEPIGNVSVIKSESAMGFIVQYMRIMYNYGAATVGIVCVLVISVSGMQYAMDSNSAEDAKKRIVNSLSGLALLFLSAVFLYFINPNFFTAST